MASLANNPTPAANPSPAAAPGPEAAGAAWSKLQLPGLRSHPHAARNLTLVQSLKGLVAGLIFGLSGGASVLLAGIAAMTKGKDPGPLATSAPSAPLVSSAPAADLGCRGCASSSAVGHKPHSGLV